MNSKKYYYFAYGSNLDTKQMFDRCPEASLYCRATLKGYNLTFRSNAKRNVADIVKEPNGDVKGALYLVNVLDLLKLDKYEGHPNVYKREVVKVTIGKGKEVEAITYVMVNSLSAEGMPEQAYLKKLIDGFNQWNLPKIKLIRALERVGAVYSTLKEQEKAVSVTRKESKVTKAVTVTTTPVVHTSKVNLVDHCQPTANSLVFVYGTLMKGFGNHRLLKGATYVGKAKAARLAVHDMKCGFPAVIHGGGQDVTVGELYSVPASMMKDLDMLEGYRANDPKYSMYIREIVSVFVEGQEKKSIAWVYVWNRELPSGSTKIADGDWGKFINNIKSNNRLPFFDDLPDADLFAQDSFEEDERHFEEGDLDDICPNCGELKHKCICED